MNIWLFVIGRCCIMNDGISCVSMFFRLVDLMDLMFFLVNMFIGVSVLNWVWLEVWVLVISIVLSWVGVVWLLFVVLIVLVFVVIVFFVLVMERVRRMECESFE